MPKRRTYRRQNGGSYLGKAQRQTLRAALQHGGSFFDTMRNSFRGIFTSGSESAPVTVAPTTAPSSAPIPAVTTATATATVANRRSNKPQINIVPPTPNQKSNELMIGGSARRADRSRRNRSRRNRSTKRNRN